MTNQVHSRPRWQQLFLTFLLAASLFCDVTSFAQNSAGERDAAVQNRAQRPGEDSAGQKTQNDKAQGSASKPSSQDQENPEAETKISPQEAEELFRSVDQILKFASQESAFPIHSQVKRRLTSRDEVTAYLEKHMSEDEDAQRLKRSESVLKKFGLLPRNFDLQKFLIAKHTRRVCKRRRVGHQGCRSDHAALVSFNDGPIHARGEAEIIGINNQAARRRHGAQCNRS